MRITTYTNTGRVRKPIADGPLTSLSGSCPPTDSERHWRPGETVPFLDPLTSVTFATSTFAPNVTLTFEELTKLWEFANRVQENTKRADRNAKR